MKYEDLKTKYGTLHGAAEILRRQDGSPESVILEEENHVSFPWGTVIPNFTFDEARKKRRPSLEFNPEGTLHSIYLENPQEIRISGYREKEDPDLGVVYDGVALPARMKAEFLSFYPDGSFCRVFPTYGRTSSWWDEKAEEKVGEPVSFRLFGEKAEMRVRCFHFFADGRLQSVTVGLGETISLKTRYGVIPTKTGVSLYPSGKPESIEPVPGTEIRVGSRKYAVFDLYANLVHADQNSLRLREDGSLAAFSSGSRKFRVPETGDRAEKTETGSGKDKENKIEGNGK